MGDVKQKKHWGKDIDFFLSVVGYSVGLGNVWRFPYLCMRNGGGAFLIPYFTCMLIAGIPLFFLEMSLGQFSGKSTIAVFQFCPLFKGLGWGMVILSFLCTFYFNVIIAWILYYLGMSFTSWEPLWGKCDNKWNTPNCIVPGQEMSPNNSTINETSLAASSLMNNSSHVNSSLWENITSSKVVTSGEEFWQFNVLDLSNGIDDFGGIKWQLVVCHLSAWIIVFACICKGVKSSGKVVYVTAIAPYIFLTAILVRGVTLPGSLDGILYYLRPDFSKLKSFKLWSEACLQIFFSLGPSWGGLITMASYNKFNHNIQRDAVLLPIITCLTSFYAGFSIFSVIGYMAREANLPIEKVITSGPGMAFIAYPEALAKVPGPAIWSVLFFLMLLAIGLDTQFVTFETCVSAFVDQYPNHLRRWKMQITGGIAAFASVVGLLFTCRAGMYWFQLLDWYITMFTLILIGILEPVLVSYIYGIKRFYEDIQLMIGTQPWFIWKFFWYFITPVTLSIFFIYLLTHQVEPFYGKYHYPHWAIVVGWMIAVCSSIPGLVFIIIAIARGKGNILQRLKAACLPAKEWGPADSSYDANEFELMNHPEAS